MLKLRTSKDFQPAQKVDFCYLCERPIREEEACNRDHVPPQAMFLKAHRGPSLWLPTHVACNSEKSGSDQRMGQLIDLIHGKAPSNPKHWRLAVDETAGAVRELHMNLRLRAGSEAYTRRCIWSRLLPKRE